MTNSNLLCILRSINSAEFIELGNYIYSSFYTNHHHRVQKIKKLYELMKRYYPHFDKNKINWVNIFDKLYPCESFNDKKMRDVLDEFLQVSEEFLSYLSYKRDRFQIKVNLLNELKNRKLDKLFEHNLHILKKENRALKYEDSEYLYHKYLINDISDTFYKSANCNKPGGDVQATADNFINYFLYTMLNMYYQMKEEEYHFKVKYRFDFIDGILNYLSQQRHKINSEPLININYNCFMLFLTNNPHYYFKLKNLKNKYFTKLHDYDLENIYACMTNYLARKPGIPDVNIDEELYKITKEQIQYGILPIDEYLNEVFFINHVRRGIKLRKFKETADFVDKYAIKLHPKNMHNAVYLGISLLYFEQGMYRRAINIALQVNKSHWFYHLLSKSVLLCCYYEIDDLIKASELIDSYKHFIHNNKLIYDNFKISHSHFVRFTERLIKFRYGERKVELDGLINNIKKLSFINKEWVLRKVFKARYE